MKNHITIKKNNINIAYTYSVRLHVLHVQMVNLVGVAFDVVDENSLSPGTVLILNRV